MIALSDFDPVIVERYGITEEKLAQVVRYVRLLQGKDAPTLRDVAVGGYYGTSALLHEVVELEMLLAREPKLLRWNRMAARWFLERNVDAHVRALMAEYSYLQGQIERVFGQKVGIGALILANTVRRDFWLLAESEWDQPLFYPLESDLAQATRLLAALRRLGKEMK